MNAENRYAEPAYGGHNVQGNLGVDPHELSEGRVAAEMVCDRFVLLQGQVVNGAELQAGLLFCSPGFLSFNELVASLQDEFSFGVFVFRLDGVACEQIAFKLSGLTGSASAVGIDRGQNENLAQLPLCLSRVRPQAIRICSIVDAFEVVKRSRMHRFEIEFDCFLAVDLDGPSDSAGVSLMSVVGYTVKPAVMLPVLRESPYVDRPQASPSEISTVVAIVLTGDFVAGVDQIDPIESILRLPGYVVFRQCEDFVPSDQSLLGLAVLERDKLRTSIGIELPRVRL